MASKEEALFLAAYAAVSELVPASIPTGRVTKLDMALLMDPNVIAPMIVVNYGQGRLQATTVGGRAISDPEDFDEGLISVEVDLWVPTTADFIDTYGALRAAVRRKLAPLVEDTYTLTITRSTRAVVDGRTIPYTRTVYTLAGEED